MEETDDSDFYPNEKVTFKKEWLKHTQITKSQRLPLKREFYL